MTGAQPRGNAESSIDLRTRVDCVRHLLATASVAAWASLFGALLVVFWLHGHARSAYLGAWFVSLSALALARLLYKRAFDRHFKTKHLSRWENGYALIMGATGLGWGLLAWIPAAGQEYNVLFCITLILLISSNTLVASRRTVLAFALGVLMPLASAQLIQERPFALFLGVGSLAMAAVLLVAYRANYRVLETALASQHRSDDLLQQLRVIFESAGEGIVFIKPRPAYTSECNRRFAEMLGYPLDVMIGMEPWRWHPDRAQWRALVAASSPVIAEGRPFHQVMRLRCADNSLFWADVTGMAVDAGDLNAGTVWVISDITEKRATEAALRHSEQRFRDLVKISSDIYWEQDEHFRFTKFDGKDEMLEKMPLKQYLGQTRWELEFLADSAPLDWAEHRSLLERHEPFRDLVYPILAGDGEKCWVTVSGNPLFDDNGHFIGYHGVSSDITSRVQSEERFRHLAFHDSLTQLPNRRLFEDRLEQAMIGAARNSHGVALLLVDLDNFKQINDQHGHAAGDLVLRTVAERILASVRESDTVARLGGDEFVVVLGEVTSVETALVVAAKIHAYLSNPIPAEDAALDIRVSIGIAVYPEHGMTVTELLERADAAMYNGKHGGGQTTRVFKA